VLIIICFTIRPAGAALITRYREEKDVVKAVVSTGAAVALCSWTTIAGYGSLLAARNRALQGFGLMAILGEVSCLSAAIIALPAVLLWRKARPLYEHPEAETRLDPATAPPLDPEPPDDDGLGVQRRPSGAGQCRRRSTPAVEAIRKIPIATQIRPKVRWRRRALARSGVSSLISPLGSRRPSVAARSAPPIVSAAPIR